MVDTIDTSIRQRFNPCIFLGEYLMRNNPKHGTKLEYESLFLEWSVVEKLRRFFHLRRQKFYSHFKNQPYHATFSFELVDGYLQTLDKFMGLDGKLHQNFKPEEHFDEPKGALSFDKFYEALQNWGMA